MIVEEGLETFSCEEKSRHMSYYSRKEALFKKRSPRKARIRRAPRKLPTIQIVIIISMIGGALGASIGLQRVSAGTGTIKFKENGIQSYGYKNEKPMIAVGEGNSMMLQVYDMTGALLANKTTSSQGSTDLLMFDVLKIYSSEGNLVRLMHLQQVAGSYSIVEDRTFTFSEDHGACERFENSTITIHSHMLNNIVTAYDSNTGNTTGYVLMPDTTYLNFMFIQSGTSLVSTWRSATTGLGYVIIMTHAPLLIAHTFTASGAPSTIHDSLLNNLNTSELLGVRLIDSVPTNFTFLSVYDISNTVSSTDPSKTSEIQLSGLTSSNLNMFTNIGSYQYVALLPVLQPPTQNLTLILVSKLVLRVEVTLPLMSKGVARYSFSNSIMLSDVAASIVFIEGNSNTLQIYNLSLDACIYRDSTGLCHSCIPGYSFYNQKASIANNACIKDPKNGSKGCSGFSCSTLVACMDVNCADCSSSYKFCDSCNSNWFASSGVCYSFNLNFSISMMSSVIRKDEANLLISANLPIQNVPLPQAPSQLDLAIIEALKASLASVQVRSGSNVLMANMSKPSLYFHYSAVGTFQLPVPLSPPMTETSFYICFSTGSSMSFNMNNAAFTIVPSQDCLAVNNPDPLTPKEQCLEEVISRIVANSGQLSFARHSAISELIQYLLAADPSGVLVKFSQNLKILIRLYYLNVVHGHFLDGVLDRSASSLAEYFSAVSSDYQTSSLLGWRGRLSRKGLMLAAEASDTRFLIRAWIYVFFWVARQVGKALAHSSVRIGKPGLIIFFYLEHAWLFGFNLMFSDGMFYGSHTLLHFKISLQSIFASILFLLLTLDLLDLLFTAFDTSSWNLYLNSSQSVSPQTTQTLTVPPRQGVQRLTQDARHFSVRSMLSPSHGSQCPTSHSISKSFEIDYPASYSIISKHLGSVTILRGTLKPSVSSFNPIMARCYFLLHSLRTLVYQACFISCQYAPALAVSVTIGMELCKCLIGLFLEFKYKAFLSRSVLIIESATHLIMAISLVAFWIIPLDKGVLPEAPQISFAFILIWMILTEHLLCIAGLGLRIFDYYKSFKSNRSTKYQGLQWFIIAQREAPVSVAQKIKNPPSTHPFPFPSENPFSQEAPISLASHGVPNSDLKTVRVDSEIDFERKLSFSDDVNPPNHQNLNLNANLAEGQISRNLIDHIQQPIGRVAKIQSIAPIHKKKVIKYSTVFQPTNQ